MMTDLEITKLCAEAMGVEHRVDGVSVLTFGLDHEYGICFMYDPLHDDAQAMALVKKCDITIARGTNYFVVQHWYEMPGYEKYDTAEAPMRVLRSTNASLNRAICECVAKMQLAKKKEVA